MVSFHGSKFTCSARWWGKSDLCRTCWLFWNGSGKKSWSQTRSTFFRHFLVPSQATKLRHRSYLQKVFLARNEASSWRRLHHFYDYAIFKFCAKPCQQLQKPKNVSGDADDCLRGLPSRCFFAILVLQPKWSEYFCKVLFHAMRCDCKQLQHFTTSNNFIQGFFFWLKFALQFCCFFRQKIQFTKFFLCTKNRTNDLSFARRALYCCATTTAPGPISYVV